jgi:hypothetical protein
LVATGRDICHSWFAQSRNSGEVSSPKIGLRQIAYCCGPAAAVRAGCERTSQRCCMIRPVEDDSGVGSLNV